MFLILWGTLRARPRKQITHDTGIIMTIVYLKAIIMAIGSGAVKIKLWMVKLQSLYTKRMRGGMLAARNSLNSELTQNKIASLIVCRNLKKINSSRLKNHYKLYKSTIYKLSLLNTTVAL